MSVIAQLPVLLVYFITGFSGFTSVTMTFLKQDTLVLSAVQWGSVAVWAGLPWSVKIIYATFIDGVNVFGSRRRSYLIVGSLLILSATLLLIDTIAWKALPLGQYTLLSVYALLMSSGVVVMDIVADTLAIDIVPVNKDQAEYRAALGRVGVNGRLSLMLGALLASLITGYIHTWLEPVQVFAVAASLPMLVITGALLLNIPEPTTEARLDKPLLLQSLIFGAVILSLVLLLGAETSQPYIFLSTLTFILYLSKRFILAIPQDVRRYFVLACLAVFCFRVIPSPAEPVQWWMIGELGLGKEFFGHLAMISTTAGFSALLLAKRWITKADVASVLIIFTLIDAALNLPTILAYYKIGDPKVLLLVETALSSPLGNLAMIPLHILLAQHAPVAQRAVYIAVTAAFVNLALTAGDLVTLQLNKAFIVTKTDFSQLGHLLIASMLISLVFSFCGIALIKRHKVSS